MCVKMANVLVAFFVWFKFGSHCKLVGAELISRPPAGDTEALQVTGPVSQHKTCYSMCMCLCVYSNLNQLLILTVAFFKMKL